MQEKNQVRTFGHSLLGRVILLGLLLALGGTAQASPLGFTPSSLNFGSRTVGAAATPMTVQLTNHGRNRMRIVDIASSLSQFSFAGPALPVTLDPGETLTGTVTFRPTSAQTYSGRLIFTSRAGWRISVSLSGVGITTQTPTSAVAPTISAQPVSQTVVVGQASTFSVVATGTAALTYQWFKNGAAIAGAGSASYTTPAATSADNGAQFKATVTNSAGSATSSTATLTVSAAATHILTVNPTAVAFGSVNVGVNTVLPATVTNTGTASVTISNVILSGPGFTASGVSIGQVLAPGQKISMNLSFTPSTKASMSGSVTIMSNATNSPTAIALSGAGVQPAAHDVTLSWNASSAPAVSYNLYRGTVSGGPYTKVTATPLTTTTFVDSTVQAATTYFYTATSLDSSSKESGFSSEVSAVVP